MTASRAELDAAKPPPPPPLYSQVQSQTSPPLVHDKPSTPSAVPFQPQQAPASSRTLHVYYDGSSWANGRILDSDKTTPPSLFRIHTRKAPPHHLIRRPSIPRASNGSLPQLQLAHRPRHTWNPNFSQFPWRLQERANVSIPCARRRHVDMQITESLHRSRVCG